VDPASAMEERKEEKRIALGFSRRKERKKKEMVAAAFERKVKKKGAGKKKGEEGRRAHALGHCDGGEKEGKKSCLAETYCLPHSMGKGGKKGEKGGERAVLHGEKKRRGVDSVM